MYVFINLYVYSMLFVAGSNKPLAGPVVLACAPNTEWYGFIEFYSSNITTSTVFRKPLGNVSHNQISKGSCNGARRHAWHRM